MTRDQVLKLLGAPPVDPWGKPLPEQHECSTCRDDVDETSIAWDTYDWSADEGVDVQCISCALQAELDREAEDER